MGLKVDRSEERGQVTLRFFPDPPREGEFEIDLLDSEGVEETLSRESGRSLVVDLNRAVYIHSRAFWSIVHAAERAIAAGGKLVLVGLSPYVARLIDLTSAAEALESAPSLEEARKKLAA